VEILLVQNKKNIKVSSNYNIKKRESLNVTHCQFEKKCEMERKKIESLTGKWIYEEDYGYGTAQGELILIQEGNKLSGKIIFSENADSDETFMIQEKIEGEINQNRIKIKATEYDIIHSDYDISYELDSWEGMMINETVIEGESLDDQGIAGSFRFTKVV
jgi:hypothetical protein